MVPKVKRGAVPKHGLRGMDNQRQEIDIVRPDTHSRRSADIADRFQGLIGADDATVLAWAAERGRLSITQAGATPSSAGMPVYRRPA